MNVKGVKGDFKFFMFSIGIRNVGGRVGFVVKIDSLYLKFFW